MDAGVALEVGKVWMEKPEKRNLWEGEIVDEIGGKNIFLAFNKMGI